MSACCVSGHLHSGTPQGHEETLADITCYISEPSSKSKSKTVVIFADIFGYKLPNTRLVGDEYAKAGFYVIIPDLHKGDSLDYGLLTYLEPSLKDRESRGVLEKTANSASAMASLGPWMIRNREANYAPIAKEFLTRLKSETPEIQKLGVVGFCFGGRYAVIAAHGKDDAPLGNAADAAFAVHPSFLAVPADVDPVTKPIAFAVGSQDSMLDMKSVDSLKEVLQKKGNNPPSQVEVYQDQVHGFGVRGDWSSEEDKKAQDDSLQQGVNWFKQYL